MKILIVGDLHLCEYSSILRSQGTLYSTRLENCVASVNWCEALALERGCEKIVYLGDFFDRSDLNAAELTAVSDIDWVNIPHYFLVGNHEMGMNTLEWSSAHIFKKAGTYVLDKHTMIDSEDLQICFLPYVLEENRKPLSNYFGSRNGKKRVIFSHNDIAGIQMGQFISRAGFTVSEIEENCDLFINGHLHNGSRITEKIINVGNITGQNFGEDGFKYKHKAFILDTNDLRCETYENPYAINFYKIDELKDLTNVYNAVVTVKVTSDIAPGLKQQIDEDPNIIASRLIVDYVRQGENKDIKELLSIDHLEEFKTFVLDQLADNSNLDLVREELGYIYG